MPTGKKTARRYERRLHAELEGWKELKEELKKLLPEAELYSVPHRSFHDEQLYCNTGEIPYNAVKIL